MPRFASAGGCARLSPGWPSGPASGAPGDVPNTRTVKVPGLPYRIIYRVRGRDEQVLEILRIHHEARDDTPLDWT
jgi:hypothetical protein